MAGMAILFGFVISYSDSYKSGVGSSVMESLVIEDVWLSPGSSYTNDLAHPTVQLSIYNVGKVDSTITSAYVNGVALSGNGKLNLKDPIVIGQHLTITLNWDPPNSPAQGWVSGQLYTFRISTLSGSNFDVTYTAP
jgi:hypothetical protein